MRHLFVVDSLDKQIQNEKELIHLASAGGIFKLGEKGLKLVDLGRTDS